MAFITDTQLKTLVAAALKKPTADLDAVDYWPVIITECNAAAYNEIVSRLAARGFTTAQIAAWDRGAEFEKRIGLYWALVEGGCLDAFDDKFIERLKTYLDWLDTVAVTNSGELVASKDCNTGAVNTSGDYFGEPINTDDGRLGEELQW